MVNEKDLATISLFSKMSQAEREKIAAISQKMEYRKDTAIISQDHFEKHLYILHKGRVKITRLIRAGRNQILAELKEGDYFGFLSFIDGKEHSASVTCTTDSVVILITRENFDQLIEENPELAVKILSLLDSSICFYLRNMISKLNDLIDYVIGSVAI